jgi:predicted phage-related endonuclease
MVVDKDGPQVRIGLNDLTMAPDRRKPDRRLFIGGSDARIIMSPDEAALIRLWKEKRGEVEPMDLSDNLVVQLGHATEALNRSWYERNTGRSVTDCQRWVRHPVKRYMAATLDGFVNAPSSRPSLLCPGRSPKRRLPKSIWPSCSTTCG